MIYIACDGFVPRNDALVCHKITMGLLPDKLICGLRMRRECRELFPRHRGIAIPRQALRHVRDARAVMHVEIAT